MTIIDPKGLIGTAGYAFGTPTWNPPNIQDQPSLEAIKRQRIDIWSSVLGLQWETIRRWGFVGAMASACRADLGGAVERPEMMRIATIIREL